MTTEQKVLCFGEALWDMLPGGRVPGGAPMNAAVRLQRFGIEAVLLTRVGADALGEELVGYMKSQGLATGIVQRDDQHPTGRVDVDTSNPIEVRYEIATPAAWDFIDAEEFSRQLPAAPEVVVFGSLAARNPVSARSLLTILERARLKIFDVNLRPPFDDRETVSLLIKRADWVKLNENELTQIAAWCGTTGDRWALVRAVAARFGIETLCVTLGGDGALLLHNGSQLHCPGFDVEIVDTIGCGDAFLGSWVAGMLKGAEPERALIEACAVGAITASRAGANFEIDPTQLDSLLERAAKQE
jgi:fructokinase